MYFLRTMIRYLLEHKLLGFVFLIGLILEVAYAVAAPLSLKYLVDEAFTPKDFQMFYLILSILLIGGTISIIAGTGGEHALNKLSGRIIEKLRTQLFVHLQKQSLSFYQRYRVGDLLSRFSSDMRAIEGVIIMSMPTILKEVFSLIMGLALLFTLEWKLTLAMLVGSVLMFIGPKVLQERAVTSNVQYKEAQEHFSNMIDESVKGHKTIKAMHQQPRLLEKAKQQIHHLFTLGLRLNFINSLMERVPLTVLLLLNGTMIGFGGYLILHDQLSVGGFIAFFTLFMTVGQSASNLTYLIPSIIDSNVSFQRINEILDYEPSVLEVAKPLHLPPITKHIAMNDVTFGYTEESDQLHGISLTVPIGSYAAFVGSSGSGKSTALQLLSRFYDPRVGTVMIDDYDLRDVSETSLRGQMDIVSQDSFLFNTTIRENLLLGSSTISENDMMEAAKFVHMHDSIMSWPAGYDTLIQNEGASLSGGQRQRLSIARAILQNGQLLLLDEVTSALDPAAEADINESIQELRNEKTIISVTHRLASVVNADIIYVFKDGRIIEAGNHESLMEQRGNYYDMWDKQHGFLLSQDGLHAKVDGHRLEQLPFFNGIEFELLDDISKLFSTETFKNGDIIMEEGDLGDKFYIIVRGQFEILKKGFNNEATRVAVLQDGDHFGEIALLKGIPRTATVKVLSHSVLLSIRREVFLELTKVYPQILLVLERTLQARM